MSTNGAPNNFSDINLKSDPKVYSPSEDSFLLADNLIISEKDEVLEVGVGSGYVSLVAAQKSRFVFGTDINPHAVKLARENAILNDVDNIKFIKTDLFPVIEKKYDLILFNPPYLPRDDVITRKKKIDSSWSSGSDGRKATERFINNLDVYLKKEGTFQLIQSSLTGLKQTKDSLKDFGYDIEITAKKKLFFEELFLISGFKG